MAKKKASRERAGALRLPRVVKNEMDRAIDRQIERWARGLRILDGDKVRKLTEEEVQVALGKKAPKERRRSASAKVVSKGRG